MAKPIVFTRIVLYISVGLFIATFFLKDTLPPKEQILKEVYQEPVQIRVDRPSFNAKLGDQTYLVNPMCDYELYGLVVSQHNTATWWDYYHKKWQDKLNLKDICVIWGQNILTEAYRRMRFRNGSWTCYVEVNGTTGEQDWAKFNKLCISNNHLLTDKPEINSVLNTLHKGDQIYLKGYLASYSRLGSNLFRGTSVTRNDEGDGACETIYLTDFKILKRANTLCWSLLTISKYLIAVFGVIFLILSLTAPINLGH